MLDGAGGNRTHRPNQVLTYRSFTGLALLTLRAGIVHYPEQWDALVVS